LLVLIAILGLIYVSDVASKDFMKDQEIRYFIDYATVDGDEDVYFRVYEITKDNPGLNIEPFNILGESQENYSSYENYLIYKEYEYRGWIHAGSGFANGEIMEVLAITMIAINSIAFVFNSIDKKKSKLYTLLSIVLMLAIYIISSYGDNVLALIIFSIVAMLPFIHALIVKMPFLTEKQKELMEFSVNSRLGRYWLKMTKNHSGIERVIIFMHLLMLVPLLSLMLISSLYTNAVMDGRDEIFIQEKYIGGTDAFGVPRINKDFTRVTKSGIFLKYDDYGREEPSGYIIDTDEFSRMFPFYQKSEPMRAMYSLMTMVNILLFNVCVLSLYQQKFLNTGLKNPYWIVTAVVLLSLVLHIYYNIHLTLYYPLLLISLFYPIIYTKIMRKYSISFISKRSKFDYTW
jgi:hypothetical protein